MLGRLIIYFPFGVWPIFSKYLSFREGTRRPPPSNVIYLKVRHPPWDPISSPPQKNVEELYSPRFNEWNLKMMGVLERSNPFSGSTLVSQATVKPQVVGGKI